MADESFNPKNPNNFNIEAQLLLLPGFLILAGVAPMKTLSDGSQEMSFTQVKREELFGYLIYRLLNNYKKKDVEREEKKRKREERKKK